MRLARAGALAIFVVVAAAGATGLYLTWSLVAAVLHPVSVREGAVEQKRTVLTQPVAGTEPMATAAARCRARAQRRAGAAGRRQSTGGGTAADQFRAPRRRRTERGRSAAA